MQLSPQIMSKVLLKRIVNKVAEFTTATPYLTVTRGNGQEIITISDNRIKVTHLSGDSHYLDVALGFEPTAALLNKTEELLCLYNESKCTALSLGTTSSKVHYTARFDLAVELDAGESIIQVLFNNVSRFAAELVVLTTNSILCYDMNESTEAPVQVYDLQGGNGGDSYFQTARNDVSVSDPVSISFGSCSSDSTENPKGDLTLYILSSDTSIYKIYPFMPHTLSASRQWLDTLFDYTTLKFNPTEGNLDSTLIPMLRFASTLSRIDEGHIQQASIPQHLQRGKLTGPVSIKPFPSQLYEQDALKLLPLPNDVLCVLLNEAVLVLFDNQDEPMIFNHQIYENNDDITLYAIDCILFKRTRDNRQLTNMIVQPATESALLVTTSTPELIQVDFSSWIGVLRESLRNNSPNSFIQLLSQELPTKVENFGRFEIPKGGVSSSDVALCTNDLKIWLIWDSFYTYATVLSNGKAEIHDISLNSEEKKEQQSLKTLEVDENETTPSPEEYESANIPDEHEIPKKINDTTALISKITRQLLPLRSNKKLAAEAEDLSALHKSSELTTLGLLSLFKTLSAINKKLTVMRLELMNQIATQNVLETTKAERELQASKAGERLAQVVEKQAVLSERLVKLASMLEKIAVESGKNDDRELSRDEAIYFKQLNRMIAIVRSKETEMGQIEEALNECKSVDVKERAAAVSVTVGRKEDSRELERMRLKLNVRNQLIDSLVGELQKLKV